MRFERTFLIRRWFQPLAEAGFDLTAFQADVVKEVESLEKQVPEGTPKSGWQVVLEGAATNEKQAAEARQAEADLKRRDVREVICAGLKDFSGDAVKLALTLTPIMVGAALSGTLTIPLTPFYVAVIVLLVARMGVSSLCAGIGAAQSKE